MSDLEWGSVPAAISSIGGILAVLLTIRILMRDRKLRESALAEAVYAAVIAYERDSDGVYLVLRLKAVNGSPAPVYDLRVHVLGRDWKRPRSRREAEQGEPLASRLFPTLMPNTETTAIDLDGLIKEAQSQAPGFTRIPPPVRFTFTDAAGRRWTRWPDGRLERVKPIV